MERRLIDAVALKKEICKYQRGLDRRGVLTEDGAAVIANIERIIDEDAPTIDAVEVVRCRECKHWGYGVPGDGEEVRVCIENAEIEMPCDGYCHHGKKRREPDGE